MKAPNLLVLLSLLLGVASLFVGEAHFEADWVPTAVAVVDWTILGILLLENVLDYLREPLKRGYLRRNAPALLLSLLFVILFLLARFTPASGGYGIAVVVIRNLFIVAKVFTRFRKLSSFLVSLTIHPAQTILLSFLLVILVGCLILMMPFTTTDGHGLSFLNALFTSTSAVCVTGLIVVDTATALSVVGQLVVLVLIQIGGLGIMLLSFFTLFAMGKSVSIENKLLISYMLSQEDMSTLAQTIKSIIRFTMVIEGAGALLLFAAFVPRFGFTPATAFLALFHSISAFCNAGFALFSDSLVQFRGDIAVNAVISILIILGGISFAVMMNLLDRLRGRTERLSLNSRVVLISTAVLLAAGTLLIYGSEHGNVMRGYSLGEQ
ncbi:potassium transporter TrkG, partial [Salinispira pacifica]